MDQPALETAIATSSLGQKHAAIFAHVLPCARLRTEPTPEDGLSIGATKIGGRPDVPAAFQWPSFRTIPLSFLGQVNLNDIPGEIHNGLLPLTGLLSFFYNAAQSTWGFDPEDAGSWAVYYQPAGTVLDRADWPDGLPGESRFRSCAVSTGTAVTLPPWESQEVEGLGLNEVELDAYCNLLDDLGPGDAEHQLIGHCEQIQGDMRLECQLVSNGLYVGDQSGYRDPRRKELESGAGEWRLLAQFGSDDNAGMMWGDLGMVYLWIRSQDLAARAFDRTWMVLQCT